MTTVHKQRHYIEGGQHSRDSLIVLSPTTSSVNDDVAAPGYNTTEPTPDNAAASSVAAVAEAAAPASLSRVVVRTGEFLHEPLHEQHLKHLNALMLPPLETAVLPSYPPASPTSPRYLPSPSPPFSHSASATPRTLGTSCRTPAAGK